ncbi:MAG: hypothetical protein VYC39_08380 [Myxococcota bacterium]|nr:hypothetical protein [Myxococcota bacterium]
MKTSKFNSLAEYRASLNVTKAKKKPAKNLNTAELLGITAAAQAVNFALKNQKRRL